MKFRTIIEIIFAIVIGVIFVYILHLKDATIDLLERQRDDCRENLTIEKQTSDSLRKELVKKQHAVVKKPKNLIMEPTEIPLQKGEDLFEGHVVITYLGNIKKDGSNYLGFSGEISDTFSISRGYKHDFVYRNKNYVLNVLGIYARKPRLNGLSGYEEVAKVSIYKKE